MVSLLTVSSFFIRNNKLKLSKKGSSLDFTQCIKIDFWIKEGDCGELVGFTLEKV